MKRFQMMTLAAAVSMALGMSSVAYANPNNNIESEEGNQNNSVTTTGADSGATAAENAQAQIDNSTNDASDNSTNDASDNSDNSNNSDNSIADSRDQSAGRNDNSNNSDNSNQGNNSSDNSNNSDNSDNSLNATASGEENVAAGNDAMVTTTEVEADSDSIAAIGNVSVNESDLTGTVSGNTVDFTATAGDPGGPDPEGAATVTTNYTANNNISGSFNGFSGQNLSAQNTGANSLIQQQVTFQGNINAGAAAAPAPTPGS